MLLMFILFWIVFRVDVGLIYVNMAGCFLEHQSIRKYY